MSQHLKVLVVGGVAAGPKAASRIVRLCPSAEVTVVQKGEFISFAGCGLPYYVSNEVHEHEELLRTPAGVVRDPAFFEKVKNVRVLNHTEATEIDTAGKRVHIVNAVSGEKLWLDYDKLVLATGASPVRPPIPGIDLANILTLHSIPDADAIKEHVMAQDARNIVIMGGGLIGVETAEALMACKAKVTLVEMLPHVLRMLDWEMARQVEIHMAAKGVTVLTNTRITAFEGDGAVSTIKTTDGDIPADMVICAVGVRPNTGLAVSAGCELGETGAIRVDDQMRTSVPDIYAAGDCVECRHILTGRTVFLPLGSTANKQGRVAANTICGVEDSFPGVTGTCICKVFDFCAGVSGITERVAREMGYDVVTVLAPAPDKAHYMMEARSLLLKLVVDRPTRKVLGVQVAGPGEGDKRLDVASMAIMAGLTVDQLANADISYAPPFNSAMDNLITAANIARNKLAGIMEGMTPMEVKEALDKGEDLVLLDVRSPNECKGGCIPGSVNIPLGTLRARVNELDRSKPIVAFCKISLRGYEAARILQAAGFQNVRVMDGGMAMWPYEIVTT